MSKSTSKQRQLQRISLATLVIALGLSATSSLAAPLNLSNNALEVVIGVEPNIMILTDDSGSMDWAMMTSEGNGLASISGAGISSWVYAYPHPDPGSAGSAPAINSYFWVTLPTQEYFASIGIASPQYGVWRYANNNYNKIYYNPDLTYAPWSGVDSGGTNYTNADPLNALYDPYNPAGGSLNLTSTINYDTACPVGIPECNAARWANLVDGGGNVVAYAINVTGLYSARYYTWTDDSGGASNGVVDADDSHTLVEIKSTTPNYTGRLAFDASTGIGRNDCTNNGDGTATCSYAQEIQNFANWFSYYRKRDLTAKAAFSTAIKPAETARIGIATINNKPNGNTANNLRVASMNISPASGNKRILMDQLFATQPSGGTPLRTSLRDTGRYFDCANDDIFGAGSSSPGDTNCPVEAAPVGQCQQNYTILMTDGFWNGGVSPGVGDSDSASGDFSGGAFADGFSNTLADVAMHYYKTDLHSLSDDVPNSARDIARYLGSTAPFETMHQHMSTYTVGFGVNGTLNTDPANPAVAFTTPGWPEAVADTNTTIDDLRHAAYNGRGQFLSAANPVELARAMTDIFNDIASATGTATAVAFNTQEVESGTLVFRASFNTKTNVGDLVAQNINPNGTVDPSIVWSAAGKLDAQISNASDSRVVITYKNNGDNTSTGVPFQWSSLNATQQAQLDNPQPANISSSTNTFGDERLKHLRGQSQYEGTNYDSGEFRERAAVAGRLGDIVHSTPVFVGKPQFLGRSGGAWPSSLSGATPYSSFVTAQTSRNEVTYVGANDGMLHAIDTSDGSELFAYVPNILMNDLSELTNPDYVHRYYVDLSPAINDAYMTPASGTNSGSLSWNTVLVGGLAGGGKGYYALNVTDPADLASESAAKNNVMWEFTEANDGGVGNSDLGYTFSQPIITMSNADDGSGNKRWVAIFGNGYNSTSTNGDSAIYVLFLEGGQDGVWTSSSDFYKISTGYGKAESVDGSTPNGIGGIRAIDSNNDGTTDYVYAGDLQGNLYRFDLSSTTPASWVSTPKILFEARYKAGNAFARNIVQPITTRPIVVAHPNNPGEFIVITATGSWMTTDDATSTGIQSIYGVWDNMSATPKVTMGSTTNQLVEQVFSNYVNPEHGFTVRTLTNNDVAWNDQTGPSSGYVKGWYIDFDMLDAATGSTVEYPGERAVRNLQLRGGTLFVNTVIPKDTTACSVGVGGYELAFNPITGGSGTEVFFDLNNDGSFGDEDNVSNSSSTANIVTGIRFDGGTPSDAAFIGSRRMTQVGDEIRSFNTNTAGSPLTGRTSWREITQ